MFKLQMILDGNVKETISPVISSKPTVVNKIEETWFVLQYRYVSFLGNAKYLKNKLQYFIKYLAAKIIY